MALLVGNLVALELRVWVRASQLPVVALARLSLSIAVVGFAQCLRYELKPRGVEVACFCPGEVDTPGLADERLLVHPAARALKNIGGTIGAETAAHALIRGIERDRFLIVAGLSVRIVHWLFRLTPLPLWNAITDAIVARALRLSSTCRHGEIQ